jgi:hypothetical protein
MWNSRTENHLHEFNRNRAGLRTIRHPAGQSAGNAMQSKIYRHKLTLGGFSHEHPRWDGTGS